MLKHWLSKYGALVLVLLGFQVWTYGGVPPTGVLVALAVGFTLGALSFSGLRAALRWALRYDEPDSGVRQVHPSR